MFNFGSRTSDSRDSSRQVYDQQSDNGGMTSYLGIGGALRERREAMGVSLAEVESATRIRQKYLAALESDEWHLLPGEVVGRGFLRNYAGYLGLEPMEVIDQRREVADAYLSSALSNTSAVSSLPPIRQVDYRPKDVELKDEGDGIERRELRLTPYLAVIVAISLLALIWWSRTTLIGTITAAVEGVQDQLADMRAPIPPTPTVDAQIGVVNPENMDGGDGSEAAGSDQDGGSVDTTPSESTEVVSGVALLPTPTMTREPTPTALATETPIPTDTPLPTPTEAVPELPTPTPIPPEPTPTETPEPISAPICVDARSVISSPGIGQVLSGVAAVTGTAAHEAFQYYKLEYAPGADATGGYVYFDGTNAQVSGGLLGNLDTTGLANGVYTLQLIVVDQTGNFPTPCRVTVTIQN